MSNIAIVKTAGEPLNVRSTPNGEIIDTVDNGAKVTLSGEAVNIGGTTWGSIGSERWVATQFLTPVSNQIILNNAEITSIPGAKIVATQTGHQVGGGLNIYRTELLNENNEIVDTVRCVSGRLGLQIPSDEEGSQTPLPFGIYTFDSPGLVEDAPGEFGGVWSAITPTFPTNRAGLGLHYDPSALAYVSQTGTSGCLATPTIEEREIMTEFILEYKPTHLIVQKDEH